MIIIAGTVDVDPEQRDAALAAGVDLLKPTREQPGCLDYVWSADSVTPGRIYVYERWTDEASLAAHLAGEWYQRMFAAVAAHGIRGADILKYRIDISEPVYDDKGVPRADFFTPGS